MKQPLDTLRQTHRYLPASVDETRHLFNTLKQDRRENQLKYRKQFVLATNPKRPSQLRFSSALFQSESTPSLQKIFHSGVLKDAHGTFWIIKSLNTHARYDLEPREARNSPRHERLAYLLAQGYANFTEIRRLPLKDKYLTRVVTTDNMEGVTLPQRSASDAYAAILVANIFMRKWDQHLNNFAFARGVPVCIDHDVIGPSMTFPHTLAGRSLFNLAYLSFKLLSLLPSLRPAHKVDEVAKERLKYHFIRQNDREAWWIMRDFIHGLGLGAGLINAEQLQVSSLRKSILAFKSLRHIDQKAEEAGFQGRDLENITTYLTACQNTLGSDVGEIWRNLTGDNAHLDRLD